MNKQIICTTCGTYYPVDNYPDPCTICSDERQYVPDGGQSWTKPEELHYKHSIKLNKIKDRLYELEINPKFSIGQRALLVLSEQGNVLWDCIPMLDEMTIEFIKSKGGLKAIGFSHPHFYSNMNEWAETFDCLVYIHKNDAEHIMVKGDKIILWEGNELELWDGIKIILIGGHFAGSSILHVPFLSNEGSIICGDTLFLSPSKKHFSVVWSSPNRMPLPLVSCQLDIVVYILYICRQKSHDKIQSHFNKRRARGTDVNSKQRHSYLSAVSNSLYPS